MVGIETEERVGKGLEQEQYISNRTRQQHNCHSTAIMQVSLL